MFSVKCFFSAFRSCPLSKDVMEEYRRTGRHHRHGMELSVEMLTTGYWPTQNGPKCRFPQLVLRCCEDFEEFYLKKHTVRGREVGEVTSCHA